MNQSATGGTSRTRISAAKMFGLIDTGQGRATLTQLGRDAVDGSGNERAARVQAFLTPELFMKMYEQNKGHVLPPAAAIERQMEQFGISPKQKERARQTFSKSATYAGFIDPGTGRFVKPGNLGGSRDEAPAAQEREADHGGGGGEPPVVDPIIAGLLKRLPKSGEVWPEEERKLWLTLLEGSFKLIYKDAPLTGERMLAIARAKKMRPPTRAASASCCSTSRRRQHRYLDSRPVRVFPSSVRTVTVSGVALEGASPPVRAIVSRSEAV